MRRLILVVIALTTVIALYRRRSIDRCERELGIGRYAGEHAG